MTQSLTNGWRLTPLLIYIFNSGAPPFNGSDTGGLPMAFKAVPIMNREQNLNQVEKKALNYQLLHKAMMAGNLNRLLKLGERKYAKHNQLEMPADDDVIQVGDNIIYTVQPEQGMEEKATANPIENVKNGTLGKVAKAALLAAALGGSGLGGAGLAAYFLRPKPAAAQDTDTDTTSSVRLKIVGGEIIDGS